MTQKNKRGAPTKFDPKKMAAVELMARRGFTDKDIAVCLGVTEQTINNWKKAHPDFFESLKDWKDHADGNVERSLYERATGYTAPETKAQWVTDETGGRWEYAEMKKHFPPDTSAAIFWMKNRQGWRDKVDHELSGKDGGPIEQRWTNFPEPAKDISDWEKQVRKADGDMDAATRAAGKGGDMPS